MKRVRLYVCVLVFFRRFHLRNLLKNLHWTRHLSVYTDSRVARDGAVGSGTAIRAGRSLVRFLMVHLDFIIDIILPVALWRYSRLSL